jgi:hypothetical protein
MAESDSSAGVGVDEGDRRQRREIRRAEHEVGRAAADARKWHGVRDSSEHVRQAISVHVTHHFHPGDTAGDGDHADGTRPALGAGEDDEGRAPVAVSCARDELREPVAVEVTRAVRLKLDGAGDRVLERALCVERVAARPTVVEIDLAGTALSRRRDHDLEPAIAVEVVCRIAAHLEIARLGPRAAASRFACS